jgi:outer membrane lipoprotein-sorting protein
MCLATVVVAVLLAAAPALADKPVSPPSPSPVPATGQPASFSVEMHMVSDGQDVVMKRTIDGPKTRMDMSGKGMNQTIIMLGDEKQTMLMIDPAGKRAMKMSSKEAMDRLKNAPAPAGKVPEPEGQASPSDGHVTLIGKDTIDGKQVDKYDVDYGDKGKGTMWVDPENNLPLRMEAQDTKIDFKNYQFGPQPKDAFEVPKGYAVTDMDEMMAKMPKNAGATMAQGMAGSMMGSMGASMGGGLGGGLGGMLGGPIGSMIGSFVGQKIGQKIGSSVGQKAANTVVNH